MKLENLHDLGGFPFDGAAVVLVRWFPRFGCAAGRSRSPPHRPPLARGRFPSHTMRRSPVKKPRFKVVPLEERIAPSITAVTSVIKVPGPTDTVVTTATNPAGHEAVGQSSVVELSNRLAKHA